MAGWFGNKEAGFDAEHLEKTVRDAVSDIMTRALTDAETTIAKLKKTIDLGKRVTELREEIETLRIEKARKQEEHERQIREVEHKVGLERKRQEFEVEQAKREATVSIREENLKADRDRFEKQLKFHEDRFTQEVGYLKEMVGEMLKRLPSAEIVLGGEAKK